MVRPSGRVDVDAVRGLDPDLVIASLETDPRALATAGEGAAVYVQPDRSLRDVVRATIELGFLLGDPPRARRLATTIRDELGRVERRVRQAAGRSRSSPTPGSSSRSGRRRSRPSSCGVPAASSSGSTRTSPLDVCDVLDLEPDVVLRILDEESARPFELEFERCGEASFPRVEHVPTDLVTVAGPRVGEALDTVARALHDDL